MVVLEVSKNAWKSSISKMYTIAILVFGLATLFFVAAPKYFASTLTNVAHADAPTGLACSSCGAASCSGDAGCACDAGGGCDGS